MENNSTSYNLELQKAVARANPGNAVQVNDILSQSVASILDAIQIEDEMDVTLTLTPDGGGLFASGTSDTDYKVQNRTHPPQLLVYLVDGNTYYPLPRIDPIDIGGVLITDDVMTYESTRAHVHIFAFTPNIVPSLTFKVYVLKDKREKR